MFYTETRKHQETERCKSFDLTEPVKRITLQLRGRKKNEYTIRKLKEKRMESVIVQIQNRKMKWMKAAEMSS